MDMIHMAQQLVFRSLDKFTQGEFALWLDSQPAEDLHHYELLDGFIVREPPAGWPHSEVTLKIAERLGPYVRRRRLGRVFESSQGFDLATGDTVEPDISYVSAARWNTLATPIRGFLKVAPNLVFEVLSPSTKQIARTSKKRIYARNGVEELVLVDSKSKSFEQFRLAGDAYGPPTRLGAADTYESYVIPGFRLSIAQMFPVE
jgi:Uma2 family endonuclease